MSYINDNADKLLTVSEAAERLNVSTRTLKRWERAGKITSLRTSGNHRRYSLMALTEAKKKKPRIKTRPVITEAPTLAPILVQKRQSNFIVACGGKLKPISVENRGHSLKQEKIDTCSETLRLWNEGLTLLQIAKARELKGTTILNHIDKLVRVGNINRADLSRLIAPSLTHSLPKIHDAFRELDTDKLFPVFEKFNGLYSYDKLRLARLLLNKKPVSKIATQSKQSGFEKIREISPNAYRPWSKGQDEKLRELFVKGSSINDLINVFGRKRGAIRSRLTKLGFMKR